MLRFQNGTCALCHQPPKKVRLAVDHDHKSGFVRALLCLRCNRNLREHVTLEWLASVVEYLDHPPVIAALGRQPQGVIGRVTNKRRRKRGNAK